MRKKKQAPTRLMTDSATGGSTIEILFSYIADNLLTFWQYVGLGEVHVN